MNIYKVKKKLLLYKLSKLRPWNHAIYKAPLITHTHIRDVSISSNLCLFYRKLKYLRWCIISYFIYNLVCYKYETYIFIKKTQHMHGRLTGNTATALAPVTVSVTVITTSELLGIWYEIVYWIWV